MNNLVNLLKNHKYGKFIALGLFSSIIIIIFIYSEIRNTEEEIEPNTPLTSPKTGTQNSKINDVKQLEIENEIEKERKEEDIYVPKVLDLNDQKKKEFEENEDIRVDLSNLGELDDIKIENEVEEIKVEEKEPETDEPEEIMLEFEEEPEELNLDNGGAESFDGRTREEKIAEKVNNLNVIFNLLPELGDKSISVTIAEQIPENNKIDLKDENLNNISLEDNNIFLEDNNIGSNNGIQEDGYKIRSGSSFRGILLNQLTSKINSTKAIIELYDAPLNGFRAIGNIQVASEEGMGISINEISAPNGQTIPVRAFAVDTNDFNPKLYDSIDSRILRTIGYTSLSILLKSYGKAIQAVQSAGSVINTTEFGQTQTNPNIPDQGDLMKGYITEDVGTAFQTWADKKMNTLDSEIILNKGKELIIIFY